MVRVAIALVVMLLLPSTAWAQAEKRIALLIGNQGYNAKVGPLKNPHNDIARLGAALRTLGFRVTELKDADYRAIDTAINRHIQTVRREGQGSISFVYYSGHGAANADTKINYLLPIDVPNADDEDLWTNSLNLNKIVESLREQAPAATHYVVFDACRNELNLTSRGKKATAEKGFAPIAYTPGVMVAYATAPGRTATDIGGGAGPYAKALADEIVKPGIEAMTMFRRVALKVNREIGQDPWLSASTLPEVYFAGTPEKQTELAFWSSVKDSTNPTVHLDRYPEGSFAPLARALVEQREQEIAAARLAREEQRRQATEAGLAKQSELQAGIRPKYSDVQAGGLFTEQHAKQIQSLAAKHGLKLPDFQIEVPTDDVPAPLRQFVGVWLEDTGDHGKRRKVLLIVTRVDKDGKADGFWIYGPPGPKSNQAPAGLFKVAGTITGETLRFSNPSGTDNFKLSLTNGNRFSYSLTNPKGLADSRVLTAFWTLVNAERSARR